jgi:hypothetical protein
VAKAPVKQATGGKWSAWLCTFAVFLVSARTAPKHRSGNHLQQKRDIQFYAGYAS